MAERVISDAEREELTAYLDGEMDAGTRAQIEAKLQADPVLRAEVEALRAAWQMLDHLPKADTSADFTHRTMHRLTAITTAPVTVSPRAMWQRISWPVVAGVLAALVAGWFVAGLRRPRPTMPSVNDPLLVRDLRVVDQLPVYAPVENLDYAKSLNQSTLFGDGSGLPVP